MHTILILLSVTGVLGSALGLSMKPRRWTWLAWGFVVGIVLFCFHPIVVHWSFPKLEEWLDLPGLLPWLSLILLGEAVIVIAGVWESPGLRRPAPPWPGTRWSDVGLRTFRRLCNALTGLPSAAAWVSALVLMCWLFYRISHLDFTTIALGVSIGLAVALVLATWCIRGLLPNAGERNELRVLLAVLQMALALAMPVASHAGPTSSNAFAVDLPETAVVLAVLTAVGLAGWAWRRRALIATDSGRDT